MTKKSTTRVGAITELKIQTKLLELKYNIFVPIDTSSKVDLIAIKDDKILRIQIKTARFEDNTYIFNAFSTGSRIKGKIGRDYMIKYDKSSIDFFATVVGNEFYLIPIEKITSVKPRLNRHKDCILE